MSEISKASSDEVILIIDDNEENRYTFGRYLRQSNFQVWTAKTGGEGLALAQKIPSLIMLDIQLPDTTGYELCRVLKTDPVTSAIPVLHTSATFTESSDLAHGLEGGADGYLIQPIDAQELTATVRALLRVKAAETAAKIMASQWQTTFDAISDGVCLVSATGQVDRFNKSFAALFPRVKKTESVLFRDLLNELSVSSADLPWPSPLEVLIQNRWHRLTSNAIHGEEGASLGTAWVFSDINSIREAELKLQNVNQELESRVEERTVSLKDAVHQMEQFSYTVSHDLRAPLRAMQGYSTALLEDFSSGLPAEARNYLERIADNAARLDKMIIDVLTFTRVSRETPLLTKIPLAKLINEVIEHYPGLKSPQAEVAIDVGYDVLANESGLMQAISNLLGNAVKFVAPGVIPKIRIWSEIRGERVRLWVEDNGIGIAPAYQHRLFGMFERVLPSSQYEGTGVGLAITRKVIERMGGEVGVESEANQGSRFWIELQQA